MEELLEVNFPITQLEVKIVLPSAFCGSLLSGCFGYA
jgi:hypothetical protein